MLFRSVKQSEYIPDFVAEMGAVILIIETKKAQEVSDSQKFDTEVKTKADQAVIWCQSASAYSAKHSGKPWKYLLVPHGVIAENVTVENLVGRFSLGQ